MDNVTILVLHFDKGHYKRKDLDELSDVEKYKIAYFDNKNCWVYEADEYMEKVNGFEPMEKYVWMYIVAMPTDVYENFWK